MIILLIIYQKYPINKIIDYSYLLFTVNDDYVAPESLNYGESSLGRGLFHLIAPFVDETTSINHADLEGTQTDSKVNACYGAFNIVIDSDALPYWIQKLYVQVGEAELEEVSQYTTTDNKTFVFPVRVTTNDTDAQTATIEVFADTSSAEADETNVSRVSLGTATIDLDSPTSYDNPVLE